MSTLAVTNTLSNGSTIQASEHNTNYSDIVTYINNRNSGSATWDGMSVSSASNVPLIVNNSTGTQDIVRFQDNGSNVMVIADGGIITYGSQSASRVYRSSSNQTINSGSPVKVQFNTETYDIQSEFDSSTNYRFTASKTGKYWISSAVQSDVQTAFPMTLFIYKNGSEFSRATHTSLSGNVSGYISDVLSLTATDYVEIFVQFNSTQALLTGENKSYASFHKVA